MLTSIAFLFCHRLLAVAPEDIIFHPTLKYTAGWIGNDLAYPKWVQNNGNCMAVAPDGTCFVSAGWEESGAGVGLYRDGDMIGRLGDAVGNHLSTASALTVYKGNVYVAAPMARIIHTTTGVDESSVAIGRYDMAGNLVPFDVHNIEIEDSKSDNYQRIQAVLKAKAQQVKGIRYSQPVLCGDKVIVVRQTFDSNPQNHKSDVLVLNGNDLTEISSIPCPTAAFLATVDASGDFWVLERLSQATALKQYDSQGKPTGKEIVPDPRAFALKINQQGHLLVGRFNDYTLEYDVSQASPIILNNKPDSVLEAQNGAWIRINSQTQDRKVGIGAMACYNDELFVVETSPNPISKQWESNRIRVFDSKTMQEKRSFACNNNIWRIVIDSQGRMWQLRRSLSELQHLPASLVETNLHGEPTEAVSLNLEGAIGLSLSPGGHLLVAGPHQQVYDYDVSGNGPVLTKKYGEEDGAYGGPNPGLMGPGRLQGLIDAGIDEKGNLYTLGSMLATGGGVDLRRFSSTGQQNWQLAHSSGFTDVADADPDSDGLDVYTRGAHFVLDPDKPPGHQWVWKGVTIDPKYDDGRASDRCGGGFTWGTPMVRRLQGRLYLYEHPGSYLGIFRKGEGEVFVPSGLVSFASVWQMRTAPFMGGHGTDLIWPQEQPGRYRWIWRDASGDGKIQSNEFDLYPNYMEAGQLDDCQWVDTKGDVWATGPHGNIIVKLPLQGFDLQKNPIYSWDDAVAQPAPKEMTSVRRLIYDSDSDTMYLAGQTAEFPKPPHWNAIGSVVYRYDHWSDPQKRTLKWKLNIPLAPSNNLNPDYWAFPAMSVSGNRLFLAQRFWSRIWTFDADNGSYVGLITTPLHDTSGWIDMAFGITSFQRKNGDHLIFMEDDYRPKIRLYVLPPQSPSPTPPLPDLMSP